MAVCANCGRKGWLLSIDERGLCQLCHTAELPNLLSKCEAAAQAVSGVKSAKDLSARLSNIAQALDRCKDLLPYHHKGVVTLDIAVDKVMDELTESRKEVVQAFIDEGFAHARFKAGDEATPAGRLEGYAKAIEGLRGLMDKVEEVSMIEDAIFELRTERDALQFDMRAQTAEVAIAKGRTKEALDLYIEALMGLAHDSTPDDNQRDRIELARGKITQLGGTPPDF